MRITSLKLGLTALGSAALLVGGATAGAAVGSPSRTAAGSPIQQALQKTSKGPTGRFSFTVGITGTGTSKAGFSISGTGGFDATHQASAATVNLGVFASVLGGAAGGVPVPKSIVFAAVKSVLYAHVPSLATQVTPGKEWLRFDPTSVPTSVTGGVQVGPLDVSKALPTLAASISAHKVGSARVRGASVTHYLGTVDLARLITILPGAQRAAELAAFRAAGVRNFPIDVYVDGSGYVRRVAISLAKVKLFKGAAPSSVELSIDLYDFGRPVRVTAPPAGKTADGAPLLAAILAGLGGGPGG